MPCRPAEYDVSKSDGEQAEAQVASAVMHRHRVRRLLLEYATDPALDLPPKLASDLGRIASDKPARMPARPDDASAGTYPEPRYGNWGLELMYRADREKKALCEARALLITLAKLHPPSDSMQATYDAELSAHRAHRQEDLEAVRAAINNRIDQLNYPKTIHGEELTRLFDLKDRADELTVDDILSDRKPLEALWP